MDLVAPSLSQKPIFVTNFVAQWAPRPCYKAEGFDPLPYDNSDTGETNHSYHRRCATATTRTAATNNNSNIL